MKILDIPQVGKKGLDVSQQGRFGQIRRTIAIVSNPRTPAQQAVRGIFAKVTALWRTLTDAQQQAWNAAATAYQSVASCGTSGPLTGSLLFNKLNCVNLGSGLALLNDPPAKPVFPDMALTSLAIANAAGVISIKLTAPTDPGETTYLRASPAQSAGRWCLPPFRVIGQCPAPVAASVDITNLYAQHYGDPVVGSKIFVQAYQIVDGHESLPTTFSARVPAPGA